MLSPYELNNNRTFVVGHVFCYKGDAVNRSQMAVINKV